jgi:ubiquitin carboxyl-terminal hydrolase 9/24
LIFNVIYEAFLLFLCSSFGPRQDSLKQLTELVHKGEKKGLFSNKMPARVQQVVREENLLFMRNRNVYDTDYFTFIRNLASRSLASLFAA